MVNAGPKSTPKPVQTPGGTRRGSGRLPVDTGDGRDEGSAGRASDLPPRRVEVQALGRGEDAVEQHPIDRATEHLHPTGRRPAPPILGLPAGFAVPPLTTGRAGRPSWSSCAHGARALTCVRIADFTAAYRARPGRAARVSRPGRRSDTRWHRSPRARRSARDATVVRTGYGSPEVAPRTRQSKSPKSSTLARWAVTLDHVLERAARPGAEFVPEQVRMAW